MTRIKVVLKRSRLDQFTGLKSEEMEIVESWEALTSALLRGGSSDSGYDVTNIAGVAYE
jgi:hypothetical protein